MNLKIYVELNDTEETVQILLLHLNEVQEQTKLISGDRKENSSCLNIMQLTGMGYRKLSRVTIFYTLIKVVVTLLFAFIKPC